MNNCESAASPQNNSDLFGVVAEVLDYDRKLVLLNLTFGRLIDDIVKPYEQNEPFFIDGVPLTKVKIRRVKIVRLGRKFRDAMQDLQRGLNRSDNQLQKIYGDQYEIRFEHIIRLDAEDVTSQVIKAYNEAVKPSIKDYIPKREELISAAIQIFSNGVASIDFPSIKL